MNYEVIELSAFTSPKIKEEKYSGDKWVTYKADATEYETSDLKKRYTAPNGYYNYLIDRKSGSTTHLSALNAVSRMVYGKGLDTLNSGDRTEDYAKMKSILSDKDLRRIVTDYNDFGQSAMQITKNGGKVTKITHWEVHTLLPEIANEKGEIRNYYYHRDWSEREYGEEVKPIPAFGFGSEKKGNEIYMIRRYEPGHFYFTPPTYRAALPYAVLEEEIGDYQINDVQNGFSGTTVVNYNNGVPDDKKRKEIKNKTIGKLTGSKGDKLIVAFNTDETKKTTVDKIPIDNAPEHYQYLSTEAENKILKGHEAPRWILGENGGGQGLSSNADEVKNQMLVFDNLKIKPIQNEIIDALKEVFAVNDMNLDLYFKTIQPLEFIEVDGMDKETKEEETGIKQELSSDEIVANKLIDCGEDVGDGWELISSDDVDYDREDELDLEIAKLNKPSLFEQFKFFVRTGKAIPNAKSEQDKEIDGVMYKVRYSYEGDTSANSRDFCKLMSLANKLYRKEDIIRMENQTVNPGWGAEGANQYSIWLYKGGGGCHHKWVRKTFKFKGSGGDVRNPNAETISTNKARKEGFNPVNEKEVSMKPKDMKNEGFLNPR